MAAGDGVIPVEPKTFFAIVVGTGFAGAVTACRLVEAGFDICVLERGRRYGQDDFPSYPKDDLFSSQSQGAGTFAPPPDFSRWLWGRDHGIYDVRDLDDAVSVQAAGYGGGSLIYANVHLRPPRELFAQEWPLQYYTDTEGGWPLERYFDLAAYMLSVSQIPQRLAKTVRLEEAAGAVHGSNGTNWFRTPLAVNFEPQKKNTAGKVLEACDMRGRCCVGCDRGAKNTLDKNYLAIAERADSGHKPDIRTLAEVTRIDQDEATGVFTVTYNDLLFRHTDGQAGGDNHPQTVRAHHVFLCAGAVNTTELLLRNSHLWNEAPGTTPGGTPLGSYYFPNGDSVAGVFDSRSPHEPDYGPTITAALLYTADPEAGRDEFGCSLDFSNGHLNVDKTLPAVGDRVTGESSGATAVLRHAPLLDWGTWRTGAAGTLVIAAVDKHFKAGETLDIGGRAKATARSAEVRKKHWFIAQDGGYPPDLEPLVGVLRSPIWLRRNRYIESSQVVPSQTRPYRPAAQHLSVKSFTQAVGGTAGRAESNSGLFNRAFAPSRFRATELLAEQISTFFPRWFVDALEEDHKDFLEQAAAMALPLIGRLLGELSKTVAQNLDSETVSRMVKAEVTDDKKEVLVRGMLRQALQIFGGSEAAVADKATTLLLDPVPGTPEQLLRLIGDAALWALAYRASEAKAGIILTMGRDLYRGRLDLVDGGDVRHRRLTARLPNGLLDSSSVVQERVLRVIAGHWGGELRTNPAWAVLGKRVTVHNQGGCPMGSDEKATVTDPFGEVHKCKGLYVMDAAAFPTSVGVNPSATIAAVAEFKIEQFIRQQKGNEDWKARCAEDPAEWVDKHGRAEIDPLNQGKFVTSAPGRIVPPLGLTFKEGMSGAFQAMQEPALVDELEERTNPVRAFIDAEDYGNRTGSTIKVDLTATAPDLARLISPERGVEPMRVPLVGSITIKGVEYPLDTKKDSYLQLFVRPLQDEKPPARFFRYKLFFKEEDDRPCELNGRKVLRDSPGFDVLSDTSTLYFEISDGPELRRGVLRLSVDHLQEQLQSITVTGTNDPARMSWGLVAFYRYFIGELATVYMRRANALKDLFVKVATGIHV